MNSSRRDKVTKLKVVDRYEMAKHGLDQDGSENEGLTQKFKTSSFVRAIQSSFRVG